MRWRIRGLNRSSGQAVEIIVEAATRDEAVRRAGATGMAVSEVEAIIEAVRHAPAAAAVRPRPPQPVIPTNVTTPIVPIMLVRPPYRWGVRATVGLVLVLVGLPMLLCGGIGAIPIGVGTWLMIAGD